MASFESLPSEVAQKCVEFLAFGEVTEWPTEVKSVSRGLRKAARWALTRGRWRPIRFVSEHGLDTLKKLRGGLNSLDDGVAATFRAAWALDPGLVMRVIREDMVDDYHGDAYQAVFLNIVEPSIEGGGIQHIIAACEGLYRDLGGQRDGQGTTLFSPCSLLRHWGGQLGRCAVQIKLHRVEPLIPPSPRAPESFIIGDALESWTDPNLAATFLDEYRQFGVPMHYRHLTAIAQAFSDNWQDRAKARSFVAEAGRIQRAWARRSFPGTYQLEEEPLG